MKESDHSNEDVPLCMACGLCCDGTIFGNVPVGADDNIGPLEAVAAQFLVRRAKTCFEQPCPAYGNPGCRIYADRPAICREFSCKLLDEYCRQEISLHQAQEKIERVILLRKNLLDTLRCMDTSLPGMALPKLWLQWDRLAKGNEGLAFRQEHGEALMQMAALRWYLWEHFHVEGSPGRLSWCE